MIAHGAASPLEVRRRALGLSRERLGGLAGGVSSATVRRIERGEVRPNAVTLAALAGVLDCEPQELLTPET